MGVALGRPTLSLWDLEIPSARRVQPCPSMSCRTPIAIAVALVVPALAASCGVPSPTDCGLVCRAFFVALGVIVVVVIAALVALR
jgi:hypothetical protein